MKIDDRLSEIFDTEPMSSTKTEIRTADGEIISQSEE